MAILVFFFSRFYLFGYFSVLWDKHQKGVSGPWLPHEVFHARTSLLFSAAALSCMCLDNLQGF